MINTKLKCISNLHHVRETLVHLCLVNQSLTKMEGLDLPNLRFLYLQQNRIEKIEGLERLCLFCLCVAMQNRVLTFVIIRCPKLQKLWLFENQISKLENLSCCSDLRELWLQVRESAVPFFWCAENPLKRVRVCVCFPYRTINFERSHPMVLGSKTS